MKLYGVLVLLVTLSAACGLQCYSCITNNPSDCTKTINCPAALDRCYSMEVSGIVTKGCLTRVACINPIECCEGDLCNSAIPTGSSLLLLLVSSAITSVLL